MSILSPSMPFIRQTKMIDALRDLGLTTNLKLCLDAGDIASVASASQTKWLDVSGAGYDFFRGADGSATATDPTFNGTPGGQSLNEYWSFDGGDYFTYDAANETWMQNLHKNNALWGFAGWVKTPSNASFFGTATNILETGVAFYYSTGAGRAAILQASATGFITFEQVVTLGTGWSFVAAAVDEAASTVRFNFNGAASTVAGAYSSPSAGSATYTMKIGATGSAANLMPSTARMNSVAMWEGIAPSAADLSNLFHYTRSKFSV